MRGFAQEIGALSALRLESCIHCGICADACHFYIATEDPKYTPIWKVEPFKQAYKREASAVRAAVPLVRPQDARSPRTSSSEWQHLLYDSCNMCGRCSLICPMGIDVAALIEQARRAMFEAGLAPKELYEKAAHQRQTGQPEDSAEPYRDQLLAIGRQYGVDIPLDKPQAEVMLTVPRTDIEHYPQGGRRAGARDAASGVSWHVSQRRPGGRELRLLRRRQGMAARDQPAADRSGARLQGRRSLIVPECGHAYTALRWEAADLYGKPLPFKVRHITEFLAEQLERGKLQAAAPPKRPGRRSMTPASSCARAASSTRRAS